MAGGAGERGVGAGQREVCFLRMIELPDRPGRRRMAARAVTPEVALVNVIRRMTAAAVAGRIAKVAGEVALSAGHGHVQSRQRKAGAVVIEAQIGAPAGRAVTGGAIGAELAAVHVIHAVTAHAAGLELLRRNGSGVAIEASQFGVRTGQRPMRIARVIEARLLPLHVAVAAVAVGPQPAGVRVLSAVTADTGGRQLRLHVSGAMAVLALQLGVRAEEREARRLQVIEARGLPATRRVTGAAVGAAIPVVNVVGRVTGHAILRRALVAIAAVTLGAGQRGMRPVERESRLVVVEARLPPGARAVAGRTIPSQPAAMRIVADVAGAAVARCRPIRLPRRVTGGACQPGMRAPQRKIGEVVIESRGIELHDVGAAPEVIHVTRAALRGRHGRRVPVQAAMAANVRGDLLVAIEAERRLPGAIADVVAEGAVLLELLVRLRQFAWHEERLGIHGLNAARMQGQSQKREEQ